MSKILYEVVRIIGYGDTSVVFEAVEKSTKRTVAVKKISIQDIKQDQEYGIVSQLHHPNVIASDYSFINISNKDDKFLNIVTAKYDEDMKHLIKFHREQCSPFPKTLLKLYAYQMIRGLVYLEAAGVVHRDIKPSNYLLDYSAQRVVLCDFGSATNSKVSAETGTPETSKVYTPPELLLGVGEHSSKSDIWSLGCTIAELILMRPIFKGKSSQDIVLNIFEILGIPTKGTLRSVYKIKENLSNLEKPKSIGLKKVLLCSLSC